MTDEGVIVQAELSLYPLKTPLLAKAVKDFIAALSKSGLSVTPGSMSSVVTGRSDEVFRVLRECFENACREDEVVLVAKISNACPAKTSNLP
ncbi:MAG: YkoF family thiamine/hydroxymethylpyrimidine-binding protein [Pseudomonadota bacterium]|nr:YkoF family thiamine/hydroxymethylpyrimidine-binding protein [Pseudomonadota bacterium]